MPSALKVSIILTALFLSPSTKALDRSNTTNLDELEIDFSISSINISLLSKRRDSFINSCDAAKRFPSVFSDRSFIALSSNVNPISIDLALIHSGIEFFVIGGSITKIPFSSRALIHALFSCFLSNFSTENISNLLGSAFRQYSFMAFDPFDPGPVPINLISSILLDPNKSRFSLFAFRKDQSVSFEITKVCFSSKPLDFAVAITLSDRAVI